ncbi:MAG: hypothetical protein ABIJ09_01375 [Pseudomonadota bacterium]
MKDKRPRVWSRIAILLGVISVLASPAAWFYALPLALALIALLVGIVARVRGERGIGSLLWPVLGLILGTGVYMAYLITTDVDPDANKVIDHNFDQQFDDDFKALVGDEAAGFGAQDPGFGDVEDAGTEDVAGSGSRAMK